ncbi:MAG: hypothetical protein WC319_14690, partial [Candidatus Paceibacterota bacterium]
YYRQLRSDRGIFKKYHSLLGLFLHASLHYTKNALLNQGCYTPLDTQMAAGRQCKNLNYLTLKNSQQWVT